MKNLNRVLKFKHFLKDKSPPVCVNFGSMVLASKSGLISNALKAVRASGYRVLLIAGWAKPPGDCDDIISDKSNCLVVKGLPHGGSFLAAHASSTTVVPVLWRVHCNLESRLLLFPSLSGLTSRFGPGLSKKKFRYTCERSICR